MLRACALKYGKSWDKSLPYVEFSYNNSYQASIEMAPFEALYGQQCRTPLFWSQTGESQVFGPEVLGCCSWGGLPSLLPNLGLTIGSHPIATAVTILWHLCNKLNSQAKPKQLKLSKTDPSTWS
jgi:hypothetical protein